MGKYVQEATSEQAVKRGKSHKKSAHIEETSSTTVPSAPTVQPDSDRPIEDAKVADDATKSEDRKARKKALKAARRHVQTSTEATERKKRKNSSEEGEGRPGSPAEKPPKKRRKNKTEFADPRNDEELNDQARRALEYAFIQMNKPEKWKFNKARQNWIIRNVWSPEAIPDIYFPLVVKYLSLVRGGPRERLTHTCESYLKEEEKTEKEKEDENKAASSSSTATTAPILRSILKPTPGPLIDISSSNEPVHATDTVVPSPALKHSITDVRWTRAQSLLEALRSSDSNI